MARKAFAVNDAVRERVRHLAGIGLRQDDIAKIIGCSPKTLRKRLRDGTVNLAGLAALARTDRGE
jgi:ParB-like chromosome segregation protein Spo0J